MHEMTRSEALEFMTEQQVGHLAVVDGDEPYVSPVSFVVSGESVYFRTGPGRRLRAILERPRVCIEASFADTQAQTWSSVCVWGDAVRVEDTLRHSNVVALLLAKYAGQGETILSFARGPGLGNEAAVMEVPIDHITGRLSGQELGAHIRPGRL